METRPSRTITARSANGSAHAGTDAAVHLAHDLIDRAARHLEVSEERLRESAANTRQALQRSLAATQEQSVHAKESARRLFRDHPVAAVGLALGTGALLALWSHGRNRTAAIEAPTTTSSSPKAPH
jgi:ElaB/YqjD/DUF883 family membrane-anchored ribosome-binding protein